MTELFVCVYVCRGVCLRPVSVFPEGRESGSVQSYHWTLYHQIHRKQVRIESTFNTVLQYMYMYIRMFCFLFLLIVSFLSAFYLSLFVLLLSLSLLVFLFSAFLRIFISPLLSFHIYLSFLLIVFLLSSCLHCRSLLTLSAHAQRGFSSFLCVCLSVSVIHIFPLIIFYLTSRHSLSSFLSFHLSSLNPSSLILFVSPLVVCVFHHLCFIVSLHLRKEFIEHIRQALYASKIVSYAQGFMLLREAAKAYGWNLNYGGIALMWRGGCIIRR